MTKSQKKRGRMSKTMSTCKDCIHFDVCDALDRMNGIPKPGTIHCGFFKDKALTIDLPCKIGTHLYRVTHPYRQEPKVTEFVVKNFRTAGKNHHLQIEVQAVNVAGTNWMRYQDFYTTRDEAEEELVTK